MGMGSLARHRQLLAGLVLGACLGTAPASANEVGASARVIGIQIHDAEETLARFCTTDASGITWFQLPGGTRFELVTSTADPAIANPGDGSFHPFDAEEVREALTEVRYPLDGLDADVFLLPYPRRAELSSAAGPGVILLAPGVTPLSREHQHAELTHELGHVVQYQWFPDSDPRWSEYREERGIEDVSLFNASSAHANRPHEIFAEDFRSLFGGALANYSGSIENARLAEPNSVGGLQTFMLSLPAESAISALRVLGANPARGGVQFAMAASAPSPLDLFDVSGRRVITLGPSMFGGEVRWSWDGVDARGVRVAAGVLLARVRGSSAVTRLTWLR
jgi:hypothetical protein